MEERIVNLYETSDSVREKNTFSRRHLMANGERLCLVNGQSVAWHDRQLQKHRLSPHASDRFLPRNHIHVVNIWEHLSFV